MFDGKGNTFDMSVKSLGYTRFGKKHWMAPFCLQKNPQGTFRLFVQSFQGTLVHVSIHNYKFKFNN